MANYSRYSPDFRIEIDGKNLPSALRGCLSSVSYQDGMEGADRVEVTFANPDLRWLGEPLLWVDKKFRLFIGYQPGSPDEVFYGEITSVEPTFPVSGMPTIKVVAHDFLQRLTHGRKDRGFQIKIPTIGNFPLPDAVAASIVSAENLLIPYPDPIGGPLSVLLNIATYLVAPQIAQLGVPLQIGQSDFDFLKELARGNGWEMYIDHNADPKGYVLRFKSFFQDYTSTLSLKYGESLVDFTPKITTVGDIFGVSARIWIPTIQMEFAIIVSWDYDRAVFNLMVYPNLIGELDDILGPENASKTLSIKPVGFPNTLREILSVLLPRLNNRLTGSGSTVGDPQIKAGNVIQIEGIGDQFGGLYRVTSATHTLDGSGYRTQFEARKEVWFGSIPLPKGTTDLFRVQGRTIS